MSSGIAPWHMWGTAESISSISGGAVQNRPVGTGQLARVSYGRPDTWDFLFGVVAGEARGAGGAPMPAGTLRIDFDLIVGLGRSQISMPSFAVFRFTWLAAQFPSGGTKWTSTVRSPVLDDSAAVQPDSVLLDHFVAEDIQCSARVQLVTAVNGDEAHVMCHSYFSPRTHVRPEWIEGRFPGGEDKGT